MTLVRFAALLAALAAPLPAQAFVPAAVAQASAERWSAAQAQDWYAHQPWLTGANYIPADAINQIEMWQADTFDPAQIDRELGWAQGLGFTSVRVFLHHMAWDQDPDGLLRRMEQFLATADKHGIGVMFVPLDGVWDPFPAP